MNRRRFLMVAGAAGAALSASRWSRSQPAHRPPNILFILADDLGYADLSCYGQPNYKTPVLDRLAAEGVQLSQGYANSAVCSATRTALVTGRYQYRLPVGLEEPVASITQPGLPEGTPTLPLLLKRLGYRTALVGKWHVGSVLDGSGPTQHGYDHFFGLATGAADYFTHRIDPSGRTAGDSLYQDTTPIERSGYLTDLLADEAIRFIETPSAQPFFLSLHFNAPHWPWEGPNDEAHSRALKDLRDTAGGNLSTYAKMVGRLDEDIGRVLSALERRGFARDTLVVFTSDNGGERFSDVWPFIGVKGELLEGGLRVPLIMRWPGRIGASTHSAQVMISMDFLPTLLAAAGGAPDPASPSDGANLLPVFLGQSAIQSRRLFWRFHANEQSAVRDGDWKYLKLGGKEHLFNLAQDERERADLKEEQPAIFARLKAEYQNWDAGMLPYPKASYSEDVKKWYADRY